MRRFKFGFTIIELLVVISIIGILASVLYANFSEGSAQSRDIKRQGDLRNIQVALELYKNKYGRYPAGCNAAHAWSGQIGTNYDCPTPTDSQYIVGLAPEFIPVLPNDPKLNGPNSGYVYTVDSNTAGSVYKIMAARTVEADEVMRENKEHPFKSCDSNNSGGSNAGVCNSAVFSGFSTPAACKNNVEVFDKSYALWGGYPLENYSPPHVRSEEKLEDVICKMP